jgi:hypothetical protein
MTRSRLLTAIIGLAASILVSVVLWRTFGTPFVFLFVPFVPLLLRSRGGRDEPAPTVQACPTCGFRTREDDFEFCPRDGTRLEAP